MFAFIDWNPNEIIWRCEFWPIFTLRWYSTFWVIGLLSAYFIVYKLYMQQKLSEEKFEPLFFYCFIGTLVGARLGHCLFYEPDYYLTSLRGFAEMILPFRISEDFCKWQFEGYAGLASHGGTIGIILMMILYARNVKMKMFTVIDNVALAVPLVACCIRLGNLMNSEIIGNVTDVPWAFIFHSKEALVNGQLAPRHPAQLYEAIAYLIIFFMQYYIYKKHDLPLYSQPEKKQSGVFVAKNKNNSATAVLDEAEKKSFIGKGFYFGFTIATIFLFRFFIEFIKKEQVDFEKGMALDMGQILSIPFVILGSWLIINAIQKAKK